MGAMVLRGERAESTWREQWTLREVAHAGSEIDRFAHGHDLGIGPDALHKALGIDVNQLKGGKVHGDGELGVEELHGSGGVLWAHGEVVANGEDGDVDGIKLADQFHIQEERRVSR